MPNRGGVAHVFQGIVKLGPAIDTHAIGSSVNCKNATQSAVVATKHQIDDDFEFFHYPYQTCLLGDDFVGIIGLRINQGSLG